MLKDTEIVKLVTEICNYEIPDWKKQYMARICKNLRVHTKGLLFSKVDTLFPNESPASKAHCVNTYEPITKGSIQKGINNISRIFTNSSFTVSASENTIEYLNENHFCDQNLFSFYIDKWINNAVSNDPNSLVAVYPKEYIKDKGGEQIRFIGSEHRVIVKNDMVVFVSEHDSEKTYSLVNEVLKREVFYDDKVKGLNSKTVIEQTYNQDVSCKIDKAVHHVFTKEYFLWFSKVDNKIDYGIYTYKKPLKSIAAHPVTAVDLVVDIQESFIAPFIPFGNLSLLQHRNHRAVDLTFSYPRLSEIQTPCNNENCSDGLVRTIDGSSTTNCSVCGGSGWITPQSPYKTYQKRVDTGLTDPEVQKALLLSKPVEFYTPDVAILDYSKDSWKEYLSMAEDAIFVPQKQKTGNVESYKSKESDKEGQYAWIQNISKALNADMKRDIQTIEDMENASPAVVSLEQPISFQIVTEMEAFDTLNTIISGDTPIFLKSQQVDNFINKFVSKTSPVVKAITVLKKVDPLLYYSNKDLQTFKSNNIITPEQWTMHVYSYPVLMQLYSKDKEIFKKSDEQIIQAIKTEIEKLTPEADASLKDKIGKVI